MRKVIASLLIAVVVAGAGVACSSDDGGDDDGDSTTTTTVASDSTTTTGSVDTVDPEQTQAVSDYCNKYLEYLSLIDPAAAAVDPADPSATQLRAEIDELAAGIDAAELDAATAERYEQCQADLAENLAAFGVD